MSASIAWDNDTKKIVYTLACDGEHGLFAPVPATFVADGYMAARSEANAAGWRRSGNMHLGPCCNSQLASRPPQE
jgi:hypothetical protein